VPYRRLNTRANEGSVLSAPSGSVEEESISRVANFEADPLRRSLETAVRTRAD
jgi:hypothetical protein